MGARRGVAALLAHPPTGGGAAGGAGGRVALHVAGRAAGLDRADVAGAVVSLRCGRRPGSVVVGSRGDGDGVGQQATCRRVAADALSVQGLRATTDTGDLLGRGCRRRPVGAVGSGSVQGVCRGLLPGRGSSCLVVVRVAVAARIVVTGRPAGGDLCGDGSRGATLHRRWWPAGRFRLRVDGLRPVQQADLRQPVVAGRRVGRGGNGGVLDVGPGVRRGRRRPAPIRQGASASDGSGRPRCRGARRSPCAAPATAAAP